MRDVDQNELERYLKIFQENPDSRVFAPLADLYRRLSKIKEAEEICREGIRRHPYYAGGRVALAHVLLDKGDIQGAREEAEAVVTYYPDNLLARKLLIRALCAHNDLDRAHREWDALKVMAPMVASDPELLRALEGPAPVESLAPTPEFPVPGSANPESFNPKTSNFAANPAPQSKSPTKVRRASFTQSTIAPSDLDELSRLKQKAALIRKKLVLEALLAQLRKVA